MSSGLSMAMLSDRSAGTTFQLANAIIVTRVMMLIVTMMMIGSPWMQANAGYHLRIPSTEVKDLQNHRSGCDHRRKEGTGPTPCAVREVMGVKKRAFVIGETSTQDLMSNATYALEPISTFMW